MLDREAEAGLSDRLEPRAALHMLEVRGPAPGRTRGVSWPWALSLRRPGGCLSPSAGPQWLLLRHFRGLRECHRLRSVGVKTVPSYGEKCPREKLRQHITSISFPGSSSFHPDPMAGHRLPSTVLWAGGAAGCSAYLPVQTPQTHYGLLKTACAQGLCLVLFVSHPKLC